MMAVSGMAAGCLAAWFIVLLVAPVHAASVFLGVLGPFCAVAGTWLVVERVAKQNPGALSSLLMAGFVVKMAFGKYGVASGPSRWEIKFSPYSMASGSIR